MEDVNKKITLIITLVTGGTFTLNVDSDISVELLKKIVSKKLKVNKERICLMNSERELQDGKLKENSIIDGSKIIVTPNVETGLAQRNENTVMQALESLNDNQVNDFLSGKSPLNLSVRLGDHMMLIQLQLSTLSPSQQSSLKQKVANVAAIRPQSSHQSFATYEKNPNIPNVLTSETRKRSNNSEDELAPEKQKIRSDDSRNDDSKSPIKSLSTMVANPLTTTVQNMNQNNNKFWASSMDPIAANLTSCLCKRLNTSCNNNCEQRPDADSCCSLSRNTQPVIYEPPNTIPFHQRPSSGFIAPSNSLMSPPDFTSTPIIPASQQLPTEIDQQLLPTDKNPALAEASRNLTQTLRKLSKRVFTNKAHLTQSSTNAGTSRKSTLNTSSITESGSSGAVIESMKHHGKGIYSGTFSGTLNPALQDKNGRPKRDISTIIHILNDLLSATPHCSRNGAKIFFEPAQSTSGSSGKFIKVKKQSNSKASPTCSRCTPTLTIQSNSHKKCSYGQCNGHLKTENSNSNCSSLHLIPSNSAGNVCAGCNQIIVNRKLEIENLNTKNKLDQLKLVMQQKKERREARKLKITPYNTQQHGLFVKLENQHSLAKDVVSQIPTISSMTESLMLPSSNDLNGSTNANTSSTTATAIATKISKNSSEIENHLEEVDTVA